MKSVHDHLAPWKGVDFPSTQANVDCSSSWAHNLSGRAFRQKWHRHGHFTSAGITDVRSIVGSEDDIEECVTSVNCAIGIFELNNKPEQV